VTKPYIYFISNLLIKIYINNQAVLVPSNTSVLEACESVGINIPRFCFHERLNVAGNCRMCLVEIEKSPKPIASCAFPITQNMKIFTDSPLVNKARENVVEFLLLNHPLDCPICDQGGECDLQDQALTFGSDKTRFFFSKRAVEDKNCGPLIKTIMTRCIHCTRCVRFFQDIVGQEDFGTTLRGKDTEIGTYVGKSLSSELSGNIIDLCPVGALTSKPYAFIARSWEIKNAETIDITDAVGSNIKVNFKEGEVLRIMPSLNDAINEEWISDKARFFFDMLKSQRIGQPFLKKVDRFNKSSWAESFSEKKKALEIFLPRQSEQILFVAGTNLDIESIFILKQIASKYSVNLISEDYLNSGNNLLPLCKSNKIFSEILESDLCLTIGTNTRFEASLLNVRIRKRIKKGNFVRASIGLSDNLSYQTLSIGNSLNTLLKILEGKHTFCKHLRKAKKPTILLGASIKKRLDCLSAFQLLRDLNRYTKILDQDSLGLNFLPLSSNSVGHSSVGIKMNSKLDFSKKKIVYCAGLDSFETFFKSLNKTSRFIVVQTPFMESSLKSANLILPTATHFEKVGTFLNLDGCVQKTTTVAVSPSTVKSDLAILTNFLHGANLTSSENLFLSDFHLRNSSVFKQNEELFIRSLLGYREAKLNKIINSSLKVNVANFFSHNVFTKNSLTLAKCADIFCKNYTNFI
jgi:NADH-quinone oxidoreductase chain G